MAHGQGGGIKDDQEGPGGWLKPSCPCHWDQLILPHGHMFFMVWLVLCQH